MNKTNLFVQGTIILKGDPIIEISDLGSIEIHDNVTLNSLNKGYHVNMHSPVKLRAFSSGARIVIKKNTRIHGTCVHASQYIEIGEGCLIASNCQIFDGSGHDIYLSDPYERIKSTGDAKSIIIGDNVWIGLNSIILPGTIIGQGSVVGAGSVVRGEFPECSFIAGNPAKRIKSIDSNREENQIA